MAFITYSGNQVSDNQSAFIRSSGSQTQSSGIFVTRIKNGLSPQTAGNSAYQIKQDYPGSTDGLYWIKNTNINGGEPFQIYADMTTLGGGWTLILANISWLGWTYENSIALNTTTPPSDPTNPTQNYSIVGWADYIKKSSANFDYMFDVNYRGYNGAAYTALSAYSFVEQYDSSGFGDPYENTDGFHKNISEIQRFPYNDGSGTGVWDYQPDGIEYRMPWYGNHVTGNAFLTTDGGSAGWWGTLITDQSTWNTAPWDDAHVAAPNIIWYWVR
jgi:hypothetical protein